MVSTLRRIGISPCRTLCSGFHHEAYRYQPMSHSMQWFPPWGVSVSAHVALYAVVSTMRRIGISPCRTLCSGFHHKAYRYQSMSHSMQWFSPWGVSVSVNVALYAVVFTMRRIGISPCRTLCSGFHHKAYRYQSMSHSMQWFPPWGVSVSVHVALYAVVFTIRRIGISPCRTLCSGFLHEAYRYQSMSHSMQWFSPWGVSVSVHVALYAVVFTIRRIGISPCRTLCSGFHHEAYRYQSMSLSIQWFSPWGVSVSVHVALYAVVSTMRRIGISPCRTLCSGFHHEAYRYQSMSHSMQWFSPWGVSVSVHVALYAAVSTMRRIGISPCRTLCSGFHHEAYRYQSMSHFMQWFSPWGVSVSVHVALYAVVSTMRRIGISPCRTLCSGFHHEAYRYQSMSHFMQWFSP